MFLLVIMALLPLAHASATTPASDECQPGATPISSCTFSVPSGDCAIVYTISDTDGSYSFTVTTQGPLQIYFSDGAGNMNGPFWAANSYTGDSSAAGSDGTSVGVCNPCSGADVSATVVLNGADMANVEPMGYENPNIQPDGFSMDTSKCAGSGLFGLGGSSAIGVAFGVLTLVLGLVAILVVAAFPKFRPLSATQPQVAPSTGVAGPGYASPSYSPPGPLLGPQAPPPGAPSGVYQGTNVVPPPDPPTEADLQPNPPSMRPTCPIHHVVCAPVVLTGPGGMHSIRWQCPMGHLPWN